ncbi:MAG: hypothetical protein OXN25_07000 [Candidatus Poribacteria bacterium]|nr:hypothetical protein [Candidatus Poribacteria bacterium]
MKKALLCALIVFCLAVPHSYSQIQWDAEKFMPLSEVKPGMKVTGYTVFFGTTVEEFECKVVSIEYNFYPGWHVVWVEGLSDNFKYTGVAGGMSGSPMYIDGRLMGALALGYFNQREHSNIFGVTAFESMVKVAERGMKPNLNYEGTQLFNLSSTAASQDYGLDMGPSLFADSKIAQPPSIFDERLRSNITDSHSQARPRQLSIPITLPPLNSEALRFVQPLFDAFNFTPVQAAGTGSPIKESPVEAGQIVGTEIVRGDVSFFGYGTITYVDGNELLAYGHPNFGEGNVNLPLSGGYVHFIFPSSSRSFKVASPTQPIGTLVQDREPAIAGIIGKHPSYIPVNVNLQTTDGKLHEKSYEVIRHRSFSPIYTGVAASYIVDALEFYRNDHTLNLDATITLKESPELKARELVYKNTYSSSSSPGAGVMLTLMLPMLQLGSNPYTKVQVENVTLDLKIGDKRRTARIQSLRMDKLRYRPGDTVAVEITLQPYLEAPLTQTGTITIPKDAPEGLVTLLAGNANFHESWQRSRAPLNFRHKNINQLINLLQRGERNSDIIMELFVPEPGLTVQGEEFENLPPSVMSVMNTAKQAGDSGYTSATTLQIDRVATDYVISGSGIIRLVVDRNAE